MNRIIIRTASACWALIFAITIGMAVDYTAWPHSGSLFIITTQDGANLPVNASESNFPLLVRLNSSNFTFAQAQSDGRDLRFAIQGAGSVTQPATALSYQIEQWDVVNGLAAIWVKIPTIAGNARQEIKMYWGNGAAASESSGTAVFNAANNYAAVLHMNEAVQDAVGALTPSDTGTTLSAGIIGKSRSLTGGKGVNCGETIASFPQGHADHSTQAWFRANTSNSEIVDWGREEAGTGGKVQIRLLSPPRIYIDGNFASVVGTTAVSMSQWHQVVHTYTGASNTSRIYLDGQLDTSDNANMNLPNPSSMWIGGWRNGYSFNGDIDEVRISKMARSANWIRMEYENQKALQTLVGTLVPAGSTFSATPATVTMNEGASAVFTGQAGGAQKVYWLRVQNGVETLLAVDQFSLNVAAGRVTGNQNFTIRFKGIYPAEPTGIKTVDIPITVSENLPDPAFTLSAPTTWNGRDTITVTPTITNFAAMQAKGVANVNYTWSATGVAVTKSLTPGTAGTAGAPGIMTLLRAQGNGTLTLSLTMDNGGTPVTSTTTIAIQEPASDAWVTRTPDPNEKAINNQFFARDNSGQGKLYYNGTLPAGPATAVFLKIYTTDTGSDVPYNNYSITLGAGRTYAFTAPLGAGKVTYKAVFGSTTGGADTVIDTVTNLICGDAYIIEGQSNAEARPNEIFIPNEISTDPWIRTYALVGGWGNAVRKGTDWWIGYWGKNLAMSLLAKYSMPICIINGAVGGTRIDQHQANPADHSAPGAFYSIYSNLLTRVAAAKLTHNIRGILWHQGESNQKADSPTGDYDWKSYQQYFADMSAAWKQDFPNLEYYYAFQFWPNGCQLGGSLAGDMTHETIRTLPALFSKMRIMSTLGISGSGGKGLCHFNPDGYIQIAELIKPLVEQDLYNFSPGSVFSAANLVKAYYTTAAKNEVALEFDQNMAWNTPTKTVDKANFYLDYTIANQVTSGSASGKVITLQLTAASTAQTITYIKGSTWNGTQTGLLYGANAIAALAFCAVPIANPGPTSPSNLTATAISASQINLAWTDNSNNETGFKVERSATLNGIYTLIATTATNATTYNNTGLTASTPYFYKVSAINTAGNSTAVQANATTTGITPTVLVAPSNLIATALSASQIELAWSDNSSNESGFKIERSTTLAGPYELIATTVTNLTSYSNIGLSASTEYFYRVSATNATGDSAAVAAQAMTLASPPANSDDGSSSSGSSCGLGSGLALVGGVWLLGLGILIRLGSHRRKLDLPPSE